jgi:4'-phosphopantetheinyl transferase
MVRVDSPSIPAWTPGPSTARASAGVLDVWRADLETVDDALEELLSPEENTRAERMLGERDRRLWVRSRGLLRALLGRYLASDPRELRFSLGATGKPRLAAAEPARPQSGDRPPGQAAGPEHEDGTDLHFNLSHSGTIALYAVTVGRAVGIDVEVERRQIDELAIAERVFGRRQAQRLAALDPRTRTREFLRAWASHEALVKCRGSGLFAAQDPPATDLWSAELDVGPHAAAAVASEGERCELRCWEWHG